eukprot:TRINITY_DN6538_c0_g1_i1.p1 TRINITY_DN6538_c0_g1~~TRINITY_DN6538_c0_g1_i1.p1  ORF type:complete len:359 (+),score=118.26 TRINITY_DN6538_c0_g1_i1:796-1872(+)
MARRDGSVAPSEAAADAPSAATTGSGGLKGMPTPEFFSGKFERMPHLIHGARLPAPLLLLLVIYTAVYVAVPFVYYVHCEAELDGDPAACRPVLSNVSVFSADRTRPLEALLDRAADPLPTVAVDLTVAFYGAWAAWGVGILLYMYRLAGMWPMISFTMTSWLYATLRCALTFAALAARRGGWRHAGAEAWLVWASEFLRFPALVQNLTTCVIWWAVLVPIIYLALRWQKGDPAASKAKAWGFMKWNTEAFLVNVHGLNVALAAVDQVYLLPRGLDWCDFWQGLAVGLAYLLFYLVCLDARGLHLYIILNPRTNWSLVAYLKILAIYAAVWAGWNAHCLDYTSSWEATAASIADWGVQ